jgi:dihydroneopterin aldolase
MELMMDTVFLRDLKIDTVIGIYGWERRVRQTLIFDLEMSADVAKAAKTDKIEDALNYKSIAKRLQQYVGESEFELIETLAEECARIIREEFNVAWVKLTLNKKGAVRGATDVGVIIERGERS